MYRTFVSFDYENDRHLKFLLEAWNKHPNFAFTFIDGSSREVQSNDIGRIKAALSQKIATADYTLVIVGKYANTPHRDRVAIGYRNWINFEIARSKDFGNKLVAIKVDRMYETPVELYGANASWVYSFRDEEIMRTIRGY